MKNVVVKRFLTLALLLSACGLAACASTGGGTGETLSQIVREEKGYDAPPNTCEFPKGLIGKPVSELDKIKFKSPTRIIVPGNAVSGDFVANRVNFKLDKKGVIRDITCG
ncbi:MAG: hypothetical protein H6865_05110 [Rhodospirillales bacterium]|nr:hypothetical protein [Alphaproteobacteria bacterium]MCB9986997.1 hypothetical protein [Rhodospirillales bacterium]USO08230.1 MAG: hypothetical protein H6866_03180 [Rhodospirillales bacterium]